jgi:hypothetical protein
LSIKIGQTFISLLHYRYNESIEAVELQLADQLAGTGISYSDLQINWQALAFHIPTWQSNWQALAFHIPTWQVNWQAAHFRLPSFSHYTP